MNIKFISVDFGELNHLIEKYVESLYHPIDSFLEQHIFDSKHYLITMDEKQIGYCSIYNQGCITQFYIVKAYRSQSQAIFEQVKRLEQVREAFVPTCDSFFLAHALDSYQRLEKQAYFFEDSETTEQNKRAAITGLPIKLERAQLDHMDEIQQLSGDFFNQLLNRIQNHELFLAKHGQDTVGFGIIEQGKVLQRYASIGMYTVEEYRQKGYGTAILRQLKQEVTNLGRLPTAGCWYYNHQ